MDMRKINRIVESVKSHLTGDVSVPMHRGKESCLAGECYIAIEAIYHMLGGAHSGWTPHTVQHDGGPHWFLKHRHSGAIIDPTASQFETEIPHTLGVPRVLATLHPSKRAEILVHSILEGGHFAKSEDIKKSGAGFAVSPQPRLRTLPAHIQRALLTAETPHHVAAAISEHEGSIAQLWGGRDFIDCDEAANLMSETLQHKKIPHHAMLGENDTGDSHAWVQLHDGTDLDPTNQGTLKGKKIGTYHPQTGPVGACAMKKSESSFTVGAEKMVATVAIFNSDGFLLMGQRNDSKKWNCPGGKAEPGELPEECARREVFEECGIKIRKLEFLGQAWGGKNGDIKIYAYKAKSDDKPTSENDPDKEVDEWEWVDVRTGLPEDLAGSLHNRNQDVVLQLLGLQEGSATVETELSKSWKHAFVGAMAAASLTGGQMAHAEENKAPKWTPAGLTEELHPIAHLESSFGKKTTHASHSKGDYHTAVGAVGLKPVTAHEEYKRTPWLQKTFPNLHDADKFTEEFKKNPAFYNHVATAHWHRLKKLVGGNVARAAYAWRWGQGAAIRDPAEVREGDPYVTAYKKLSVQRQPAAGLQNPLAKAEVEQWLQKAGSVASRSFKSKDGIIIPAHGTAERHHYNAKFEQGIQSTFGRDRTLKRIKVPIEKIASGTNAAVNKDRLSLYQRMARLDKLPPVVVKRSGEAFHLVDGNHREAAARLAGLTHLDAFEIIDEKPKQHRGSLPKNLKLYNLGEDTNGLMQPKMRQTKHGQFFEPVEMPDVEKKLKRLGYHGYHGHSNDPSHYVTLPGVKLPTVEEHSKRKA